MGCFNLLSSDDASWQCVRVCVCACNACVCGETHPLEYPHTHENDLQRREDLLSKSFQAISGAESLRQRRLADVHVQDELPQPWNVFNPSISLSVFPTIVINFRAHLTPIHQKARSMTLRRACCPRRGLGPQDCGGEERGGGWLG